MGSLVLQKTVENVFSYDLDFARSLLLLVILRGVTTLKLYRVDKKECPYYSKVNLAMSYILELIVLGFAYLALLMVA